MTSASDVAEGLRLAMRLKQVNRIVVEGDCPYSVFLDIEKGDSVILRIWEQDKEHAFTLSSDEHIAFEPLESDDSLELRVCDSDGDTMASFRVRVWDAACIITDDGPVWTREMGVLE